MFLLSDSTLMSVMFSQRVMVMVFNATFNNISVIVVATFIG